MPCPECNHQCNSLNQCLKFKEFNDVVAQAKRIVALKKYITLSVPHFKGKTKWLNNPIVYQQYVLQSWSSEMQWKYRFMTITFDPKKFSFNELTSPNQLENYILSALNEVKHLLRGNIILVREYHKSGIPHYHMNYDTYDSDTLEHLKLRMKYYFASSLRNTKAVHDRIFNAEGVGYIQKYAKQYYEFINPDKTLENLENNIFSNL